MRARFVGLAMLLVAAAACGAPRSDEEELAGARNLCLTADACPPGSTCVDRTCLALPPSSLELVAEITPSVASGLGAIPRYLPLPILESQRTFFERGEGAGGPGALVMPALEARTYSIPPASPDLLKIHPGCPLAQVPLVATLVAAGPLEGLAPGAFARVDAARHVALAVQDLPYDLYVRPEAHAEPGDPCQIAPFLVRGAVDATPLPQLPRQLRVRLLGPSSGSLAGYRAEIVDQASGLRVSTVGRLFEDSQPGALLVGVSESGGVGLVDFYPPASPAAYWLVLSPPPGVIGPKLAFDASFFGDEETVIDLSTLSVSLAEVEARLVTVGPVPGTTVGAAGTLLARARSSSAGGTPGIDGVPPGVLAWFEAEVTADPTTGIASFVAPVGVYDVAAMGGASAGIGRAAGPWELRPPPGQSKIYGMSILLPSRARLRMDVVALGQPGQDVAVEWSPVPTTPDALERMFRGASLSPRRGGSTTDVSGALSATLEQGGYDVSVRFEPRAALPWIVAPEVAVDGDAALALSATAPYELRGTVLTPEPGVPSSSLLPLAGGALRIFARHAGRLLPVALVPIGPDGAFRAFVPSAWTAPSEGTQP